MKSRETTSSETPSDFGASSNSRYSKTIPRSKDAGARTWSHQKMEIFAQLISKSHQTARSISLIGIMRSSVTCSTLDAIHIGPQSMAVSTVSHTHHAPWSRSQKSQEPTQLFENLKLPELQTRKRSQRELRNHSAKEVIKAAEDFAKANAGNDKLALEALWATWGQQQISQTLLKTCLASEDHRIRSAAVRVLRHTRHLHDTAPYLLNAAKDSHPRVRIEALAAGSWLGGTTGAKILLTVASQGEDKWINNSLNAAMRILKPQVIELFDNGTFKKQDVKNADKLLRSALSGASAVRNHLSKENKSRYRKDKLFRQSYELGRRIFHKEGSCGTCHMDDGRGDKKTYPPIAKSPWVTGNEDRLIKLTLHGLWGKIEVNGRVYDPAKGVPPMTAVGAMFNDKEVAAVLTYVRNSWGNVAEPISAEKVKELRDATKSRKFFYKPEELLSEHPFPTTN